MLAVQSQATSVFFGTILTVDFGMAQPLQLHDMSSPWVRCTSLDDVGETDHGKISTANGGLYGSIAWLRRRWCRGHQMKHLETKFLSHGIKCLWNKRDSSRQPRVLHSFHMKMFKFLAHANSMHDRWGTPVMLMIHFLWPQFSSLPNHFIVYFKNQN